MYSRINIYVNDCTDSSRITIKSSKIFTKGTSIKLI